MDVRDSLQSALGTGYRIDREIGRGGMSRVFLARDATLNRDVVVKVLPPELAAEVSVERFKREVQIAASLQHPHIVPVLAAGELDGLPYYTMPYIEGESLRERLARSGRLPVSEALAVLRDIARALAYAHRRGVAHRDVKPENVLLTNGVAVVTDFGIAKALSAARIAIADDSLTKTGMSLGTPAYMAPEQAAGDPETDHRADVYAFGVVAYELLSGNTPFHGRTPRELLAAQMAERPRAIDELCPELPAEVARLVMRCLEKDPDARPQSADELTRQLDTLVERPSGAIIARRTPDEPALIRRAIVLYATAFALVAAIAWVAMLALGLPDWVLPAALIVMGLGVPVLLVTGVARYAAYRVTAGTASLATGGAESAPALVALGLRASRHVTWRRFAAGGAAAVCGLALFVGGFMTLRALGIGPPGTLLAAGKLSPQERLLVTDFKVSGVDSTLGAVIGEATRVGLAESRAFSLVTPAGVADALRRMERARSARVDLALAREIAAREGIGAIVDGDVTAVGNRYLVALRLVAADSGNTLASFHAAADDATELIPAVDGLTRRLRSKIGESLKTVRALPPLARVTTSSLDALQRYTAGMRAHAVDGDPSKAVALLREAVTIDTAFAMAWRALGAAMGNAGMGRAMSDAAITKAYRYRDRLTERERLSVSAHYYWNIEEDAEKAAAAYEGLLERGDTIGAFNLAQISLGWRNFARAEWLYKRIIANDSSMVVAYGNLLEVLFNQSKIEEAESTLALAIRRFPRNPRLAWHAVGFLYLRGDLEAYNDALDSVRVSASADRRLQSTYALGRLALTRGRLQDHRRLFAEGRQLDAARGVAIPALIDSVEAATIDAVIRGEKGRAVRRLDASLIRFPLSQIAERQRPYLVAATAYARAARPDRARTVLAQYYNEARDTAFRRMQQPSVETVLGEIALAEGRPREAIAAFRRGDRRPAGPVACVLCLFSYLGRAFDRANEPDSAIAMFEKYVSTPYFARSVIDRMNLGPAYERLAQLYDAKGSREEAVYYYARFAELWKDADAELQPRVTAARRRIAALRDVA